MSNLVETDFDPESASAALQEFALSNKKARSKKGKHAGKAPYDFPYLPGHGYVNDVSEYGKIVAFMNYSNEEIIAVAQLPANSWSNGDWRKITRELARRFDRALDYK